MPPPKHEAKLKSEAGSTVSPSTHRTFRPYVEAQRVQCVPVHCPMERSGPGCYCAAHSSSGKEVFPPPPPPPPVPTSTRTPYPRRLSLRGPWIWSVSDIQDTTSPSSRTGGASPASASHCIHERQRIFEGPRRPPLPTRPLLDLILLPGVAFDAGPSGTIRRLRTRRSSADYFISRHHEKAASMGRNPRVLAYGLALSEQFTPSPSEGSVPVGPLDQPLRWFDTRQRRDQEPCQNKTA